MWEGNEEQRGRAGILSLMAGASASDAVAAIGATEGPGALARSLEWLGSRSAELLAWRQIVWESDPFARGGYAFFDPAFDPSLRAWLARPCGRLFFAGEHTSLQWQGYMNGAVEVGPPRCRRNRRVERLGLRPVRLRRIGQRACPS